MAHRKRYLFVCQNRRPETDPRGSCAARGSEGVHAALKALLAQRGLAKLEARACSSSCLDACEHGVTVLVEPDHILLGHVTEADVPALVDALESAQWPPQLLVSPSAG